MHPLSFLFYFLHSFQVTPFAVVIAAALIQHCARAFNSPPAHNLPSSFRGSIRYYRLTPQITACEVNLSGVMRLVKRHQLETMFCSCYFKSVKQYNMSCLAESESQVLASFPGGKFWYCCHPHTQLSVIINQKYKQNVKQILRCSVCSQVVLRTSHALVRVTETDVNSP